MTVYEAVTALIDKKKDEKRMPHCAMLEDVKDIVQLPDEQFREEMKQLKRDGKIAIRQTVNSFSIYLR